MEDAALFKLGFPEVFPQDALDQEIWKRIEEDITQTASSESAYPSVLLNDLTNAHILAAEKIVIKGPADAELIFPTPAISPNSTPVPVPKKY